MKAEIALTALDINKKQCTGKSHQKQGRSFAYMDIRNVCSALTVGTADVFIKEYGGYFHK